MKTHLILLLILMSTIAACTEPTSSPSETKTQELSKKTFEIKIADTESGQNRRIADLTIDQLGDIQLIPMTQDPLMEGLKSLIIEIKSKPGLFFEYDTRDGGRIVLRKDLITPSDPRYIYPLTDELGASGYLLVESSPPLTVTITQGTQYNSGDLHIGVVSVDTDSATLSIITDSEQKTVKLPVGEVITISDYTIKNMQSETWAGGWMPGQSSGKVIVEISQDR